MAGKPIEGEFTPKAVAFLIALANLCRQHRCSLAVSGYDGLQVWDMQSDDEVLNCSGVEDCTKPDVPEGER